jgi:hypothetical protein
MRSRLIILALHYTAACGELHSPTDPATDLPPDPTATFTRVKAEIFTPTCATVGCHHPLGQESQLVLTPDVAYTQTVNRASVENAGLRRVEPGDPANSYLYRKIIGSGITGERMPQNLPPLSAAQIALVRDWIRRGAPND